MANEAVQTSVSLGKKFGAYKKPAPNANETGAAKPLASTVNTAAAAQTQAAQSSAQSFSTGFTWKDESTGAARSGKSTATQPDFEIEVGSDYVGLIGEGVAISAPALQTRVEIQKEIDDTLGQIPADRRGLAERYLKSYSDAQSPNNGIAGIARQALSGLLTALRGLNLRAQGVEGQTLARLRSLSGQKDHIQNVSDMFELKCTEERAHIFA